MKTSPKTPIGLTLAVLTIAFGFSVIQLRATSTVPARLSIRKLMRATDAGLSHYRVRTIVLNGTDYGGELKGYYAHHRLRKIKVEVGLSSKMVRHSFYFGPQGLEIATSEEFIYRWNGKSLDLDRRTFHRATDNEYYFSNGKLVSSQSQVDATKLSRDEAASLMLDAAKYKGWLADGRKSADIID